MNSQSTDGKPPPAPLASPPTDRDAPRAPVPSRRPFVLPFFGVGAARVMTRATDQIRRLQRRRQRT